MKITPENIVSLKPNEIFVFGSNLAGRHGAGAALTAWKKFGMAAGVGWGQCGQSFALPTKDKRLKVLPIPNIRIYIKKFLDHARNNPDLEFLVTAVGTGLSRYSAEDIAPLFTKPIPPNVSLPKSFWDVLENGQ